MEDYWPPNDEPYDQDEGCTWGRLTTDVHGTHDVIDYEPLSPHVQLILEILEWVVNHNGELDPFHAAYHNGYDGLDEQWAELVQRPSLLDEGGDECGV